MSNKYFNMWDFLKPNNDPYMWTFVIGGRSVGKTVNSLAQNIKYCYETDQRFIYMRRWQADFDRSGGHIDLPLISRLSGYDVQIKPFDDGTGSKRQMIVAGHAKETTDKEGKTKIVLEDAKGVGYFVALSTAQKTRSSAWPNVWLIIYDEFIPVDGRELPKNEEWSAYVGFLQTVFRDPRKAKSLFIANAIPGGEFNSYFVKLNLFPKGKITRDRERGVKIVQYAENEILIKERANSKLYKILESTGESQNDFSQAHFVYAKDFIKPLTGKSKMKIIYNLDGTKYGLWYNKDGYILSTKFDQSCQVKYILDKIDPSGDFIYDRGQVYELGNFLRINSLFFDSPVTRGIFLSFLKKENMILK